MSHYKPYPAYKDSGTEWLGRVPEHWEISQLKYLATHIGSGKTPSGGAEIYQDSGVLFLRSQNIYEDGLRLDDAVFIPESVDQEMVGSRVQECDVLLNITGASIGRSCLVPEGFQQANVNQHVCIVRAAETSIAKWLSQCFPSLSVQAQIDFFQNGAGREGLNFEQIGNMYVALPLINEVGEISDALESETARIDALISKKTRFIELLREKRQALITHAVTKGLDPKVKMKDSGAEWLGEVPEHWQVVRLRDLCVSISTGPFGTALGNEDYVNGGVPVINPSHIVDSKICADADVSVSSETANRLGFWRLAEGDLVAARRGELGRAAVVMHENDGWLCGTGSLRVRPRSGKSSVDYLHAVLQSRYAREWLNQSSVGATMANLNEGILGSLPVAVPLDVAEQAKIVEKMNVALSRLDVLDEKNQRSIELLKERRSALITAAVTGQIDLREAA